ncbi:nitric oxide synthase, partial [Elysia marginata]
MGALMAQHPHRPNGVPRSQDELSIMAKDFIDQYFTSLKKQPNGNALKYELSYFGVLACKDRGVECCLCTQRRKPNDHVFDARHILTARGMFEALCNHIKYATNKGNLRSAITIFPQRKEGRRDFRLWNSQLVRYAGYKMEDGSIIGDPAGVEFTDVCVSLGWKPKYGKFDVLPLVLSAAGSDPELFDIPPELVLEVNMRHPKYPWFAEMGLKWYVLPAVANMLFDCGGLEFPACPFNGWYMGSEIGARDFCDAARYNITEEVALKMGLDTRKSTNLWKDRVLVEVNIAVLHSFQTAGVTITDHHSASESFIKHMDNEHKLRGGCPADWVWVVPPMSGSLTEVFHQEMLLYKMKPSYEYQDPAWKTHVWVKDRDKTHSLIKPKRKFGFKELASTSSSVSDRAVKFSAKLMGKALARRVKCLILYATETGKSERFAETLCEIFKHAFDAKVMCLDEYDVSALEHESLVVFVSSTFGNGDPPENGESFAQGLFGLKSTEQSNGNVSEGSKLKMSTVRQSVTASTPVSNNVSGNLDIITGPLGNVRYSVFALGSTAYPHFCAFGRYLDQTMRELGAESICRIGEGDELCGQEQSFRQWAEEVFKAACDTFCLGDDVNFSEATGALSNNDNTWKPNKFRISTVDNAKQPDLCEALSKVHGKSIMPCVVTETTQLQAPESDRQTILVRLSTQGADFELAYVPGDHVGIYPANNPDLVESVLTRLHNAPQPDEIIRTEVLHEVTTPLGSNKTWTQFEKMPVCSLRMAFTHVLDLTTPPSQALLKLLATLATRDIDKERLEILATDSTAYEDWKYEESPNMLEVLEQFPSLKVPPSLLLTQLPILQQRYYSISSSPRFHPGEIHATIAVVRFRTKGGAGPIHEGVCSGWLNKAPVGTIVPCMVRAAQTFHLPENPELPVIMVGPGTGIAPFRSFWEQRFVDIDLAKSGFQESEKPFGPLTMYFGCRASKQDNIYGKELEEYHKNGALTGFHVALSREPNMPK